MMAPDRPPPHKAVQRFMAGVRAAFALLWRRLRHPDREPRQIEVGAASEHLPAAPNPSGEPDAGHATAEESSDTEADASFPGQAMAATLEGSSPHDLPEPPAELDPRLRSRRRLLAGLSLVIGGLGTAIVGVPVVGSLLWPLFRSTPNQWRAVGPVENFKVGETTAVSFDDAAALAWSGVSSRTAAWLRRESEDRFIAFKVSCTHLGCPVRWLSQAKLFMCPCHGGVFYQDGTVAAGPPQQPLHLYPVRVNNGQVEIRTGPIPIT